MDPDSQSLQWTIASLHRLLETPADAEQIDLNVPRETKGPIFDIPFYIGGAGSSCLSAADYNSSNLYLDCDMKRLPLGEGRINWKMTEDVQKITDCVPDLNRSMEGLLSQQDNEVRRKKRTKFVEKRTIQLPDMNWNPDALRNIEVPVPNNSCMGSQQSESQLHY